MENILKIIGNLDKTFAGEVKGIFKMAASENL